MTKVCILVGEYWPAPSANGVIARNIATELAGQYEVSVVARRTRRIMPKRQVHEGVEIRRVDDHYLMLYNALQSRVASTRVTRPLWSALLLCIRVAHWIARAQRRSSVDWAFARRLEKALDQLQAEDGIDVLIPVPAPHEETFAAVKYKEAHPESILLIYQLDRFANADSLYEVQALRPPRERRNRHLEERALVVANGLFILPPLCEHYSAPRFVPMRHKINRTEHPLLRDMNTALGPLRSTSQGTVFLYAGSLDLKLRNPTFLLSVLSDERLHAIGLDVHMYTYGTAALLVRQAADRASSWLHYHGRVCVDEVHASMARADVLITVGNNSDSEVPSKLFECLSFGKPIIHFYFSERDPYLEYLKRYPQSLTLKIGGHDEIEIAVSKILAFCAEGMGGCVSLKDVMDNFRECTPNYVADQFNQTIGSFRKGTA